MLHVVYMIFYNVTWASLSMFGVKEGELTYKSVAPSLALTELHKVCVLYEGSRGGGHFFHLYAGCVW